MAASDPWYSAVQEGILAEKQLQRLSTRKDGGTMEKVAPSDRQLGTIDIEEAVQGLTEEQAAAIREKYADGLVGLALREMEVEVDGRMLRSKLGHAVQAAAHADEQGLSVTETTTHDHSSGRTELIVGNTATAERGKLSNAQRGSQDRTLWYVIIAALVIVALAFLR